MATRLQKKDSERLKTILDRINQYDIRFPVAEISENLNVDSGNVSNMLKGKKPISDNFFTSFIEKYPDKGRSTADIKPQNYYLDASIVKVTLQDYINKIEQHNAFLQRMIESGLVEIKVSLNDARADLEAIEKWQWAEHKVQMQALDKLTKKDPGTLAAEAGTLLSGDQLATELAGRKTNGSK